MNRTGPYPLDITFFNINFALQPPLQVAQGVSGLLINTYRYETSHYSYFAPLSNGHGARLKLCKFFKCSKSLFYLNFTYRTHSFE